MHHLLIGVMGPDNSISGFGQDYYLVEVGPGSNPN
jgi:hypothetical protein